MTRSVSCSWCHTMNQVNGPTGCSSCGHRADVCRLGCDCGACRRFEVKAVVPAPSNDLAAARSAIAKAKGA